MTVGFTRNDAKLMHFLTDMYVAGQEINLGKLTVRQYLASLRGGLAFAILSLKEPQSFYSEGIFPAAPGTLQTGIREEPRFKKISEEK